MKKLSIILFLQILVLSAQAGIVDDNYLHLADIEIDPGETQTVQLLMTNANIVAGVQGNIKLPAGLSFVKKSNGRLDVSNNNDRAEDFTLSCALQNDGSMSFAQYSGDGFNYEGNSGAIFTFKIKADENATAGTYEVSLLGVVLSIEGTGYDIPDRTSVLVVKGEDPVTVTANNLNMVYGDVVPELTYTSEGATLQGTPTLTCEATSTSPVGTYPIVVTQGTVTNTNVTFVNGTLTITKAPLTIKGGTYTIKQGEPLPTFSAIYEGFKNNETNAVLTTQPTLTTTATSSSAPGTYDIVVSGASAQNYEISYVKGTLTITEADPVTVTANSYIIEYGDALPTYGFTSEGATLQGTPEITCEATATSPAGVYPIVISKGSITNYNVTYVNGTLTIKKAPLIIKAGTYTMTQGEALPTFTATYEGFKNNETNSVLTTQPTLTTTATSNSEPGTYDVVVSGAEAQNYEISYVNGTLTIIASTGICSMTQDEAFDVYDLSGRKICQNQTQLPKLPKGMYIVNGKKYIVK